MKCFDPNPFECIDFHWLSQIIASLTRDSFAEREAEVGNLPWTQTETDSALAKCRLGLCAWCTKKPVLCLHAVADGHRLETKTSLAGGHANVGARYSKHAMKAKGTINAGKSTETNLMNSWPQRRNLLQAMMGFRVASTDVREDWVRRFYSTHTNTCWKVVLSLHYLPKAELSTTMEGLLYHRRLFAS